MDEFFYTATQELSRQAELALPERPYKYQSEIIIDWFRYFDTLTDDDNPFEGRHRSRDKRERQKWLGAQSEWEAKLWVRWQATEKSSQTFPLIKYARVKSLSPDEIKILLYIFYKTMERNPLHFEAFELLKELYCDHRAVFDKLPLFRLDRLLVRERLIVIPKYTLSEGNAAHDFAREFVLSDGFIRLLCGFEKKYTKDGGKPQKGHADLLWITRPKKELSQVILKPKVRQTIDETLLQLKSRKTFDAWGFNQVLEKGHAVAMLFYGPPGTGKTLTAEAIAGTLKRKLAIVNVAGVHSMWFGETEKNLVKIFRQAEKDRSVLLLDEADSILSGRAQNEHWIHNREVSILLRMIEDYNGIVILTTNMATILDPALERRINPKIEFPPPDFTGRLALWQTLIPKKLPLAPDVNIEFLAGRYELTGGQIKNAVVSAARAALATTDKIVTMDSIIEACAMEQGSLEQGSLEQGSFKQTIGFG